MNYDPNSNSGGTPYNVPPYGSPPSGGPPTYLQPHRGTMVLVFGIVGLVMALTCACGPLGIVAWVMGNSDLKAMREGSMDRSGEGITRGGQICGVIATVIWTLIMVVYGAFIGLIFLAGATGSSSSGITPVQ